MLSISLQIKHSQCSGRFCHSGQLLKGKGTNAYFVRKLGGKIWEEKLYLEDTIKIVKRLKPSKAFGKLVSTAFSKFAQKCNQDIFLMQFHGEIYKNWKAFFPACNDQKAVNVLLIHFPQKLIAYYKQFSHVLPGEVEVLQRALCNKYYAVMIPV